MAATEATVRRRDCQVCLTSCTPGQLSTCPFCDYDVCKSCCRRWLLSLNEDPSCMNCKTTWSNECLHQLFGPTFVNTEWKQHRQNVLLDREVAKLPETAPYVTRELQIRDNRKRVRELEKERDRLRRAVHDISSTIRTIETTEVPLNEAEKREFIQRCARPACDGFLSSAWKCRSCHGLTCRDCGVFRGVGDEALDHVCVEADKASMELIRRDSRRCVACGTWTFKVHGCNKMYCVAPGCNTSWDWKTGRKVTGVIHNPEYFRMRRELNLLNRDPRDVPCGGAPSMVEIHRKWPSNTTNNHVACGLLRLLNHITAEELPRFPDHEDADSNRDLRILFTLSEITREKMKAKLQQREKKNSKDRSIHAILQMFVTTTSDCLRQAMLYDNLDEQVQIVTSLVNYMNGEMKKISTQYGCVVPMVYRSSVGIDHAVYWRVRVSYAAHAP